MRALRAGGAEVGALRGEPALDAGRRRRGARRRPRRRGRSAPAARTARPTSATCATLVAVGPQILIDDGAELIVCAHADGGAGRRVLGATEETTTGLVRLRAMAAQGALRCPVLAVNETRTERIFNDRYGTGQSTLDGILRATNLLLAGPRGRRARLRLGRPRRGAARARERAPP